LRSTVARPHFPSSAASQAWRTCAQNAAASITQLPLTRSRSLCWIWWGEVAVPHRRALKGHRRLRADHPPRARPAVGHAIVAGTVVSAISGSDHRHHRAARQLDADDDGSRGGYGSPPAHGDGADHGHRRRRTADPAVGALNRCSDSARLAGHLDRRPADRRHCGRLILSVWMSATSLRAPPINPRWRRTRRGRRAQRGSRALAAVRDPRRAAVLISGLPWLTAQIRRLRDPTTEGPPPWQPPAPSWRALSRLTWRGADEALTGRSAVSGISCS